MKMKIITGDIYDPKSLRKARKGIDDVYHLGALFAILVSYNFSNSYVDTNIK